MIIKPKAILEPANFVSGKPLSRRTLLRGVGAALALPMLDAMTPAFANAPERENPQIPDGLYTERYGDGVLVSQNCRRL